MPNEFSYVANRAEILALACKRITDQIIPPTQDALALLEQSHEFDLYLTREIKNYPKKPSGLVDSFEGLSLAILGIEKHLLHPDQAPQNIREIARQLEELGLRDLISLSKVLSTVRQPGFSYFAQPLAKLFDYWDQVASQIYESGQEIPNSCLAVCDVSARLKQIREEVHRAA